MNTKAILVFFLACCSLRPLAQLKVTFPAADGVVVTADWYPENSEAHTILLCHQDGYSRGEYKETAVRLNQFGFNCLAIDLRVGKEINGIRNETAADITGKGHKPGYIDAEKDMLAAIDYLYEKHKRKIIILGSSYSASLALIIANSNSRVYAVAAFSPGEYFPEPDFIAVSSQNLKKPVFLTSSREESESVTTLTRDIQSLIKVQYIPKNSGGHGSKVLWPSQPENQDYWAALMSFLNRLKKEEW